MALSTLAKSRVNRLLGAFNIRIETLTAETLEARRLADLATSGHFTRPVFSVLSSFDSMDDGLIMEAVNRYRARFRDFEEPTRNDVGYTFRNEYFTSPDAEVLYAVVREFKPGRIVEVGSGQSTKVIRQAILDGRLTTRLVSVDPEPRVDITCLADTVYRLPVEALGEGTIVRSLEPGDILFIDSSHVVKTGSDVVFLYLIVLPFLASGVLIHIHDIFLPYDYPQEWVVEQRRGWNEQYLVQALLMFTNAFEVLWAGYFLQRTREEFSRYFPHAESQRAQSLWLRKTR